jgi:hypothetical protein
MILEFADRHGVQGRVELIGSKLTGFEVLQSIVEHRMDRDNIDAAAAMRTFDGWSNGYVSAKLIEK